VIDDGRIIEEGSHDELVARAGDYAQMYETWISHGKHDPESDPFDAGGLQRA